ncbi:hypothetical protein [Lysobacter gummosus]|uniref:hypothetical protein n=1 Tax=Lysobacter gummosus TaxID=262324 RepID=UPI0036395774
MPSERGEALFDLSNRVGNLENRGSDGHAAVRAGLAGVLKDRLGGRDGGDRRERSRSRTRESESPGSVRCPRRPLLCCVRMHAQGMCVASAAANRRVAAAAAIGERVHCRPMIRAGASSGASRGDRIPASMQRRPDRQGWWGR